MRVHVLQHVANEGLGSIAAWLTERDAQISFTHWYKENTLPSVDELDLVIALGGPMSVNDEATLSWLVQEKQFLREVMQQGIAVLGICLGAQLIANALGSRVYPNHEKEIGWFPVMRIAAGKQNFQFPDSVMVFHWHGETFDLPVNAVHIARSTACEHQAFQIGKNIIGLQFHLETNAESAQAFIDADNTELPEKRELVKGKPYIQTAEEMLTAEPARYASINALMEDVLNYLMQP